nr:MAG TPA: hypothetical protein [Caudoviricetes sp.]DAW89591.1 MAG TPA: hypothetical protein [Bacteriophage sp.]
MIIIFFFFLYCNSSFAIIADIEFYNRVGQ